MPDASDASQPTVRSVERALDILEVLERSTAPLRLVDLAKGTGLHAATVLRLAGVLQRRGLVEHEAGEFRLGAAALGAAHRYLQSDPLVLRARPHLQELSTTTGLTSSLYRRLSAERILVARVDGVDPVRYQLPLGRRLPLHVGAGRAILAFLPDEEREALLEVQDDFTTADGAAVSRADLRASVDAARERGFHVSVGERAVGVVTISVPVLDAERRVLGALSALGPDESHSPASLERWAPELRRAAAAIAA
ncbi:IclR family transcriptional regulator [Agrococcus sp. SGAir0287]|uniref:IclR family transcriptional regulator n=1 Tax=Agrococcus sp. SGAir0287 TaxID=2070347 RepID=UPI0010CD52B9|nr:IclR family transcriptional regulator [Agrococcus sp. SGAir0287]QCR18102.1 IclR family transcriptional regulator [Agrococcus sp. SGAir0287]